MKKILLICFLATQGIVGQNWYPVGQNDFNEASTARGWFETLVIDSNNVPYISYLDVDTNKVTVRKFVNGVWVTVGAESFSTGLITYPTLDIDSNNVLYVGYYDDNFGEVVKKFNGTTWVSVGTDGLHRRNFSNLKLDHNNVPYVTSSSSTSNYLTTYKFNGTAWVMVGAANYSGADTFILQWLLTATMFLMCLFMHCKW